MLFNGSLMKSGPLPFHLPSYFLTSFLSHSRRFLTEISSPHCFPLSAVSPFHMAVCPRYFIANTFQLSPEKTLALILRAQPDTTPSLENLLTGAPASGLSPRATQSLQIEGHST